MTKASPLTIISLASQNPERQEELRRSISQFAPAHSIQLLFPADDASTLAVLHNAEILFTWQFNKSMLDAAPNLKWIHVSGAGVDSLIFPEFRDSEIVLTNSRGIHGPQMAEWVLSALLHISQNLSEAEAWRRDHQWKPHKQVMTRERFILQGRRSLIVGYGAVGQAIAQRLQANGLICEAVASDARKAEIPVHSITELSAIISRFDIVVSALPLTPNTAKLFDHNLFSRMKPSSIFVNVGRGKTVDESALITALTNGPLAYAALDVFAQEPLPENSPLFSLPNLFMTPHVSGNFPDYSQAANKSFLANLERYVNNQPLLNIVDKQRGY